MEIFKRLFIGLGIVISIWYLFAFINPIVPLPHVIFEYMLMIDRIESHFLTSLSRIMIGCASTFFLGLMFGLVMGEFRICESFLKSIIGLILAIPATIWAFLSFMWFGFTTFSYVFVVIMATFPIVTFSICEGVKSRDIRYDEMGGVFRFSRWKKFRRIFLPHLFPYIIGSARSALGELIKIMVFVELLGSSIGMGYVLQLGWNFASLFLIFSSTVIIVTFMLIIDYGILYPIDNYATRWRRGE